MKPKPSTTITARFDSLPRALDEARKYGVTAALPTVQRAIQNNGVYAHYITVSRVLSLSRAQGRKQWKMAVDVQGRVVPVEAN